MERMSSAERERTLERLMQRYGTDVMRVCVLTLRDRQLGEDAAQETFIKAWSALERLKQGESEKAWLMRIAMNTCRDMLKSGYFRHTDRRTAIDALPEAGRSDQYRDDTVIGAVYELPQVYREIVIMHYYQGFALTEAASILGIPQSTARTRLFRAREMLKQRLEGWYFDNE